MKQMPMTNINIRDEILTSEQAAQLIGITHQAILQNRTIKGVYRHFNGIVHTRRECLHYKSQRGIHYTRKEAYQPTEAYDGYIASQIMTAQDVAAFLGIEYWQIQQNKRLQEIMIKWHLRLNLWIRHEVEAYAAERGES